MRLSPSEIKALEAKQRRLMQERDQDSNGRKTCRMERLVRVHGGKLNGFGWEECGKHPPTIDPAHWPRRDECGSAKYDVRVVTSACRECHKNLDGNYLRERTYQVRVPFQRALEGYLTAVDGCKVIKPKSYYDPRQNDIYEDPAA